MAQSNGMNIIVFMVGVLKLYFSGPAWCVVNWTYFQHTFLCKSYYFNVLALLGLHDLDDIVAERRLVTTTVAFLFMSPFLAAGAYTWVEVCHLSQSMVSQSSQASSDVYSIGWIITDQAPLQHWVTIFPVSMHTNHIPNSAILNNTS